jgi:hypothetical protein
MSNHYPLLAQTPQPNLSRGMHWLNGRFAQYFNRRHKRRGHLFQDRFHGILVEKASHLLNVARYVVLNPVRAGIVNHPADWKWSSYRQTAGLDMPAPWLAFNDLLETFGGANPSGCAEYVSFVASAEGQTSPWDQLTGQIYLGSPAWIDEITARIASQPRSAEHPRVHVEPARPVMTDIIETVAKTFDCTVQHLATPTRDFVLAKSVAAFIAFEDGLYRQSDIAVALSIRGRSTVSSMIRRCRELVSANADIAALVKSCRANTPRRPVPSHWTSPGVSNASGQACFRPAVS